MAQKLKKSALMFGQTSQEPLKPTLSQFYGGVGEGQVGAVQKVGQGVTEEAAKLPGAFGLTYDDTGKASFAEGSTFKPTVAIKTTTGDFSAPQTFGTSASAAAGEEAAGKAVETLKSEKSTAESELGESVGEALKSAGEVSSEQQKKLTEGKLGERREASELEKQAQEYRNVLSDTPGTSNISAVANLMKFYDMGKYGALESGLRQGEIALSRQQAGTTEAAMQTAEGARQGAIEGFKTGAEQGYKDVQNLIEEERKTQLSEIEKFYKDKLDKAQAAGASAKEQKDIKKKEEDDKLIADLEAAGKTVENNSTISGLNGILNQISGRAGNNWLNTQGNKVLLPIKGAISSLTEEAIRVKNDPNLPPAKRTERLNQINTEINGYRGQIAGELAAFLGDSNTRPGDALDAAEQIMSAGLIDALSQDQITTIRNRIKNDSHIEYDDKNNLSSIEKLNRIFKAFGGTEDLYPEGL